MQLLLFPDDEESAEADAPIALDELFQAYFDCRRNKRGTVNALAFEADFEANLVELHAAINDGSYFPGRSIDFIVEKPVKREVFAADFRDRIVHHLLINKIEPLLEKEFIYDSYSCRDGKGTHLGIQRVDRCIRRCSRNYSEDCYILKLDIRGFFMHIDRGLLFDKLRAFLLTRYKGNDRDILVNLCGKVINRDPARDCIIKGPRNAWDYLPWDKSLFHSPPGRGLPIGNLTSQVFANFYLNGLDHFVKHDLGIRYYGRYVDDFFLVHEDRERLKTVIPLIRDFLSKELGLTLHPNKIYLQHFRKGVRFLGTVIMPRRIYIASRTKGNFYNAIRTQNRVAEDHKPNRDDREFFLSSMNSYLGIMKHYASYRLRTRMIIKNLSPYWRRIVRLREGAGKFSLKPKNDKRCPASERG